MGGDLGLADKKINSVLCLSDLLGQQDAGDHRRYETCGSKLVSLEVPRIHSSFSMPPVHADYGQDAA
jgi:hypothetical protein